MESYDGAEVLGLDPGIERAWRDGLKPDPLLSTRVEDCYLVLSQRASSEPGRWRTERTPYLKEMMDPGTPCLWGT
jgi:phage terminase large subunit GpA-like protein